MADTLDLRLSWIAPDTSDPYGIGQRLLERKELRLNGFTPVSGHVRRRVG